MKQLRVAQMVADTEAEGPGKRFALWVQGCSLRCPGCCNPEMFAPDRGGQLWAVPALAQTVAGTAGIEGISVLGGEPFEQAEALTELCRRVRAGGLSVMIYSGYSWGELKEKKAEHVRALLAQVDVLVDGRYVEGQPEPRRRWVGSANQSMHFLTPRYGPQDSRFGAPNTVEVRLRKGQLTVNGWPGAAEVWRRP